jgi:tetratricopeptide (TPR) repeat protein
MPVLILMIALLCSSLCAAAPADDPIVQQARKLADEQRWQDLALLLGPLPSRSADLDFYYGTALAGLQRWPEAESAFAAGHRLAPHDPRFPVELAGAAFKQKHYPQAARSLRQALRLAPHDAYANDFLGTVYFLQGNLEASLKYWNRVGKPVIAEIHEEPVPRVSPALLDRAFAFSPAAGLQLTQFIDTSARIDGLQIFPQFHFNLSARGDGKFDVLFRSQELDGFGSSKWEIAFNILRELPFSSVDLDYYNLHREAINVTSMYRWDARKRRIFAQFSSPFERSAKVRYEVAADLRNEQWAIRNSFKGPAPALATLNLRREAVDFEFVSHASGRLGWSGGAEVSHRDFRNVIPGAILTPELLAQGYQLQQRAQLTATLWRLPERRFTVNAGASSQAARLWSHRDETFEKLQGSLGWHWLPHAEGDDYEMLQQFRAGKTFGPVPFDELFILGLERDNDLPMRGHIGTRDGKKGSAPLGRDYFLANWETDKNLYGNGIVALKLGPFLDIGKITDPSTGATAPPAWSKWLFDIGAQAKLRVFGSGVVFSYGKDLRSGNNAFYVMLLKKNAGSE